MDWTLLKKTVLHFKNKKIESVLTLDSIGVGEYENKQLIEYEYTLSGKNSNYRRSDWNTNSGVPFWELKRERIRLFDGNDQLRKSISAYWVEDSMKVVPMSLYDFTYDVNNHIASWLGKKWDFDEKKWVFRMYKNWYYEDYENGLVGIQNLAPIALTVYPNPATDYISFELKDTKKQYTVQFFSATGALLFVKEVSNNQRVRISHLSSGMYYYIIKVANFIKIINFSKHSIYFSQMF